MQTSELRAKLDSTLTHVMPAPSDGYVALLGWPNHSNVGDHLIWLGQIAWLKKHGYKIGYWSSDTAVPTDALDRRTDIRVIVLSGGGNLGDLYPAVQEAREKVIERFPTIPIVQLPQSVHFNDPRRAEQFDEIVTRHPRFTLMVRDKASAAAAAAWDPVLAPDAAFAAEPPTPVDEPTHDVVWLLRPHSDTERLDTVTGNVRQSVDWFERTLRLPMLYRVSHTMARRLVPRNPAPDAQDRKWRIQHHATLLHSRSERHRGVKMLSQGRVVVTDRLHGLILAVLLGKPVVGLDNNYGKVSAFVDTWLADNTTVTMAGNPDDAEARARSMVEH